MPLFNTASLIGAAPGSVGVGTATFNEFTIKKTSDKASPAFFRNCVNGAHNHAVTMS